MVSTFKFMETQLMLVLLQSMIKLLVLKKHLIEVHLPKKKGQETNNTQSIELLLKMFFQIQQIFGKVIWLSLRTESYLMTLLER